MVESSLIMNSLTAIKTGRQGSYRANALILLCVVLSPQGCNTFSVTLTRQCRTRHHTLKRASVISEHLSRRISSSCLFADLENSSIACSDKIGNKRISLKISQPAVSKSSPSPQPLLGKKRTTEQGEKSTTNLPVRLEKSNRSVFSKPTSTKNEENATGVIQTTHNTHHHTDNLEGAVFGMTSLLVLTYLTIFLSTPAQIDPFSPSELCWATTNGYIVALIAHFLRREERLRRHAQNLLPSEVEPCKTSTVTSTSAAKKNKTIVKQPSVKATAVDGNQRKQITVTTTTPGTRIARIINPAVFALLAKKTENLETTVIKAATVQKPKIRNDFIETLRAFQKDAAAKKARKKASSNGIHESIP